VTTDGRTAWAQQVYQGRPTPNRIAFTLEDGVWKLDLARLSLTGEAALKAAAQQQGTSIEEFVDLVATQALGPEKAERMWEPIDG
jgi:hypothetical protein